MNRLLTSTSVAALLIAAPAFAQTVTTPPNPTLTVGTTVINSGSSGDVEYNNSGVLGEKAVTGTGSVVLATSPSLTTPAIGVAAATSINGAYISGDNTFTTLYNSFGEQACGNGTPPTGHDDNCFGLAAGKALTSGAEMNFLGFESGEDVSTGTDCIGFGSNTLWLTTACTHSIAMGLYALGQANASGGYNIAEGYVSLTSATSTTAYNVGIGPNTLQACAANCQDNIALAAGALNSGTALNGQIAIGVNASHAQATSISNAPNEVVGNEANYQGTDLAASVEIGDQVGFSYISGAAHNGNWVYIGSKVAYTCTTCYENVIVGSGALELATSSYFVTAMGVQAVQALTTGYQDTAIGLSSLGAATTAYDVTALGHDSGYQSASTDCVSCTAATFLGTRTKLGSATQTDHETVIGADAAGQGVNNAVTLGRPTDMAYVGGVASMGSVPTLTGTCTTASQVGGNTAGKFTATCAAQTVIVTFAETAKNGWNCNANDNTTPADTLKQTSYTQTSCTLTGTTATADVITFNAVGF